MAWPGKPSAHSSSRRPARRGDGPKPPAISSSPSGAPGRHLDRPSSSNRAHLSHSSSRHSSSRAPSGSGSAPFPLKKSRSQHFLEDESVLRLEAEALQPAGRTVAEIGAGDGRLSAQVLALQPASLSLIELDGRFAGHLRARFAGDGRVRVLQGDFLKLAPLLDCELLIGNIPYQITSDVLLALGSLRIERAVLCIQKEVAERLLAAPGDENWGRLSVYAQAHFSVERLAEVGREKFTPPPKVDSAIVRLSPRPQASGLPANFEQITAALFSHRLQSPLSALVHERRRWGWSKEEARSRLESLLANLNIDKRKVMHLGVGEIAEIAHRLPPATALGGNHRPANPADGAPTAHPRR